MTLNELTYIAGAIVALALLRFGVPIVVMWLLNATLGYTTRES